MRKRFLSVAIALIFVAEIGALSIFAAQPPKSFQDPIAVNEAVQSVERDWGDMDGHRNQTSLDYVVLDGDGRACYETRPGLSDTINKAVAHRDTVLDIQPDGLDRGKIIIWNDSADVWKLQKQTAVFVISAAISAQMAVSIGYGIYLERVVVKPFRKLKGFAERIAGGNLDIPLEMDRQNLFGAFTEGFDIMRSELKKARQAEAEANAGKKELVAKLSHDIKTPVASIKAVSEVGAALAGEEKSRDRYMQIVQKADQIDTLVTNLFTAALEELGQLPVVPVDIESQKIGKMLENSDYLGLGSVPSIPDCLLYADELRLQQVFDNLFANSYKYANTKIDVAAWREKGCLAVSLEDYGGGASPEELPLLKEKYKRGINAESVEGAGLGLFISDYFMEKMQGELVIENGQNGLRAIVRISLSGANGDGWEGTRGL